MKKSTYAFTLGLLIGCLVGALGFFILQKTKYKNQFQKFINWLDLKLTPQKPLKKPNKTKSKKLIQKKFIRKSA